MTPQRIDQIWTELLAELEHPPEPELRSMVQAVDAELEQEISRLNRDYPNHWREELR